jgi:hypothetical protein
MTDSDRERVTSAFLNLSNHPISTWSAEQVEAARAIGLGEPVELAGGMPRVDPAADESAVESLAREVAARAAAQDAAGAFVASDLTFTFALVRELQARGVRCFAATTEREVEERVGPGGESEKRSVFRFVRWREYA